MLSRQSGIAPARRKGTARASIAAQGFFVPLLTVWGAALAGLPIAVLSSSAIARIIAVTGTGALGPWAQPVYSAFAALIGAVIAFAIAREIHDRAIARSSTGSVLPILAALSAIHTPQPAPPHEKRRKDVAEEPEGSTRPEPVEPRSAQDHAGHSPVEDETSKPAAVKPQAPEPGEPHAARPDGTPRRALAQLRSTPPDELSLLQMVERFAAAMHEQQRSGHPARRGEALAEALQALELFTPRGFDLARPADEPSQSANAASL